MTDARDLDLDLTFLKRAGAALSGMSDQLRADEAAARRREQARFEAEIRRYAEFPRHYVFGGFCNLVAACSVVAERMAADAEDDGAVEDYVFASEVLQAVQSALDLHYGSRSSTAGRKEALERLKELIGGIKP